MKMSQQLSYLVAPSRRLREAIGDFVPAESKTKLSASIARGRRAAEGQRVVSPSPLLRRSGGRVSSASLGA